MVIALIKFETNLKIPNECTEDTRYLLREYISSNIWTFNYYYISK